MRVSVIVDKKKYRNQVNLAFSPNQIETTQQFPSDFVSFWQKELEAVRNNDFEETIQYLPEYSSEKVATYLLKLQTGTDNKSVYGYLCKPRTKGKYPVLFAPPGAGIKPIKPYLGFAEQGYISLSIEIHGINPLLDKADYKQISSAFGNYMYFQFR